MLDYDEIVKDEEYMIGNADAFIKKGFVFLPKTSISGTWLIGHCYVSTHRNYFTNKDVALGIIGGYITRFDPTEL